MGARRFNFYTPAQGTLGPLLTSPDWYLVIGWLVIASIAAILWRPLLLALPLLMVMLALSLLHASLSAVRASFPLAQVERIAILKRRFITAFLHTSRSRLRVLAGELQPLRIRIEFLASEASRFPFRALILRYAAVGKRGKRCDETSKKSSEKSALSF